MRIRGRKITGFSKVRWETEKQTTDPFSTSERRVVRRNHGYEHSGEGKGRVTPSTTQVTGCGGSNGKCLTKAYTLEYI